LTQDDEAQGVTERLQKTQALVKIHPERNSSIEHHHVLSTKKKT